jgi:hypothetical protein
MTNSWKTLFLALAVAGCGTSAVPAGPATLLGATERSLLRSGAQAARFIRFWRLDPAPPVGIMRWDGERSSAAAAVPDELLQLIRDELGRVNQTERQGEPVRVAVRLEAFRSASFWRSPSLRYEITGRTLAGTLLWAAEDEVRSRDSGRSSLADSDDLVLARGVVGKLRAALGL